MQAHYGISPDPNLTGDYVWAATDGVSETSGGFRPLRAARDATRLAA